jgi:hypothetical protein
MIKLVSRHKLRVENNLAGVYAARHLRYNFKLLVTYILTILVQGVCNEKN